MEKKADNQTILDEDLAKITQDFQLLFGEMCDLISNPQFTTIFRNLHSLLMDSHTKNKSLTQIVQMLNCQIVSNATKVSSLLKMSEDDKRSIERMKEEYSKIWKMVSLHQENEQKSLDFAEELKTETTRLRGVVSSQTDDENKMETLKQDISKYTEEIKSNEEEFETISIETQQMYEKLNSIQSRAIKVQQEYNDIVSSIQQEDSVVQKLVALNEEYQSEMASILLESNENDNCIAKNSTQIKDLRDKIVEDRQEMIRYKNLRKEYQDDFDQQNKRIKSVLTKKEEIIEESNKIQGKMKKVSDSIEEAERNLEMEKMKCSKVSEIMDENLKKMNEIEAKIKNTEHEIIETTKLRKQKGQEIIAAVRAVDKSEMNNRQQEREGNFVVHQIEKIRADFQDAKMETQESQAINENIDIAITQEKEGQAKDDLKAFSIDFETKKYEAKAHEAKVNFARAKDTQSMINTELEASRENLRKMEKSSKEQQKLLEDMRHDRDVISNKIEAFVNGNKELELNIQAKNSELLKLKTDIQNRTEECIRVHYQTETIAKQIQTMNGSLATMERLFNESRDTITGYKAEGTKLRLIYDEAHKSIDLIKTELDNLEEVKRLVARQISRKDQEISKMRGEIHTLQCILDKKNSAYLSQSEQLNGLMAELERTVNQNQRLTQRTSAKHLLEMEVISLETRLIHEKEVRNRFELEFERPMNIHRWTILKSTSPHIFNQIMMIQQLKHNLEVAVRKQDKCNERKSQILKEIELNNKRMRTCKIQDGKQAMGIIKNTLIRKDQEIMQLERELKSKSALMKEMKEAVDTTKYRMVQTHIAATKKQGTKTEIPIIAINTSKAGERSRLGGGFSLASARDKGSIEKMPKTSRIEYMSKRQKDEESNFPLSSTISTSRSNYGEISRPNTARTIKSRNTNTKGNESQISQNVPELQICCGLRTTNQPSWKPKKNSAMNDLCVRPAISARSNSELDGGRDPLKKKPVKNKVRPETELRETRNFNPMQCPSSARRTKVTKTSSRTSETSQNSKKSQSSLSSSRQQFNVHVTTINIDPFS